MGESETRVRCARQQSDEVPRQEGTRARNYLCVYPGHTHGHHSHIVSSGNNTLLVQADVTAGAATLFVRNPDWQFVFDSDKPLAVETRKKLYDMAAADKMMVQGFHLRVPGGRLYRERAAMAIDYVPATWMPVDLIRIDA